MTSHASESCFPSVVLQINPRSMACTSTLAAGSMNQAPPKQKLKIVNRWVCDVCKVAAFSTLEEACVHEEACGEQQQGQEAPALSEPSPPTSQESLEELPEPQPTKKPAKVVSPQAPHSFFKPKKATAAPKEQSKPATKKPINPFFKPKSAATSKKVARKSPPECITINDESTKTATAAATATLQKKKPKTPTSTSSMGSRKRSSSTHRQKDAMIDVDQHDVIDVDQRNTTSISQTAASLASVINLELEEETTKRAKFAGMFATNNNNKALLAEQRQVEFQAKRFMERQRELERQQKRAAMTTQQVQLPVPTAAVTATKPTAMQPLPTSDQPKTCAKPTKRPPTAAKKLSLPLTPRFPVPSHVIPPDNFVEVEPTQRWLDASRIAESRRYLPTDISTPQDISNTTFRLLAPTENNTLSCSDDSRDLLREAFRNLLQPPESLSDDARLWSEKYGMDGLVGAHSQQNLQRLLKWVDEWCKTRSQAMERMAERQRKLVHGKRRKIKKKTKKDVDLWSDDSDDEFGLCNICVVTGPAGSGKSGLVHTVAKQSHCQLLELNTTDARGSAALKHRIQEATQSCSSLDMLKSQTELFTDTSPTPTTPLLQDTWGSDDDEGEPEAARSSLTVILIDEVDILFENQGDNGFWSALTCLAKTAKCPIFLTANTVPPQIMSLKHKHVVTARPTPEECASKLWQVAKQEQFSILKGIDGETVKERLAWMAHTLECDLRRLLQEMQLFAYDRSDPQAWNKQMSKEQVESMAWTSSIPKICRPKMNSIEPRIVSSDKYSIITLKGENFQALADLCPTQQGESSLQVHVASQVCPKICLVDDKTILALCPPCAVPLTVDPRTCRSYIHHRQSLDTRVASVSIRSKSLRLGILTNCDTTIETSQLVDEQVLSSLTQPVVDYFFPGNDDEECEFSPEKTIANNGDQSVLSMKLLEEGIALWDTTLEKLKDRLPVSHVKPEAVKISESDKRMQEELERLSTDMQFGSDAALLEDMQFGIPFLSGACRGFGFDLTNDQDLTEGKLRMHENTKPPSVQRLYELGWTEKSYFFGDKETYMTIPSGRRERRLFSSTMRGVQSSKVEGAAATTDKEEAVVSEDIDDTFRSEGLGSDEDVFLTQNIPASLLSLPCLLREARCPANWNISWTNDHLLERRRQEQAHKACDLLSCILSDAVWLKMSCHVSDRLPLGFCLPEDAMDPKLFLEYLPTLRRIAVVEKAAEYAFNLTSDEEDPAPKRRSTRRTTKATRSHYFDSISRALKLDQADLSASELGSRLAPTLLCYEPF